MRSLLRVFIHAVLAGLLDSLLNKPCRLKILAEIVERADHIKSLVDCFGRHINRFGAGTI